MMKNAQKSTSVQKRFAIFLPALYGGGAERTMLNLARGMAERGYAVDLVLAQAEGPYLKDVPSTVRLVDLGQGRLINKMRTLRRLPSFVRYLRQERPDALLSALTLANFFALSARRLAGLPGRVVVNEQNTLSQDSRSGSSRLDWMLPYGARFFYGWADNVVGVSQGVVDDLVEKIGISKELVKVIHNPGVTHEIRTKIESPLDHPWFQPGEPPVFLGVGRLIRQKDFPTLLKAFALVRKTQPARLLILGEGPDRPQLEALAQELGIAADVAMPGFVENPYAYMTRAAAFVLSSLWEGLPTVLMEALYCGVPIVSTDCPSGPREILRHGEIGRLTPMRDPQALAQGMLDVLAGKVPRPTPESWQPYELDTIVEQYVGILLGEEDKAKAV